jgi:galactosylceramidase
MLQLYLLLLHLLSLSINKVTGVSTPIIDFDVKGPVFDGIGAISGGGGETVLLPHYPEKQRNEILDLLLKPSFGASLHILKVEVGGDALSTDGAEPSHMHMETVNPNFLRGYEFWMMSEGKKRNPSLKLYGLPWEWPSWIGQGTSNPYQNLSKPLHYITEWLRGAKNVWNVTLDYFGIWNENQCNSDYVVGLRKQLDISGFENTLIIAPDSAIPESTKLLHDMVSRSDLAKSVYAIGYHYPNSDPCAPTATLKELKYPRLWASEDDSTVSPPSLINMKTPHPREQPGGGCLVRTINQNFVQGNITATIIWNLIMARYPQMRWDYTGLMVATDPFNGHYDILPAVWAIAHTTQFTEPGWRMLPVVNDVRTGNATNATSLLGGSGWLHLGGTYVTYVNDDDITIVIEKMDLNQSKCERGERPGDQLADTIAENVTFSLIGGLRKHNSFVLWSSHFGKGAENEEMFVQKSDVPIINGKVTIEVRPNHAYTLSTIRTAKKGGNNGEFSPPPKGEFPISYFDDFEDCHLSKIPKFVAPMAGAFECVLASGKTNDISIRQMSPSMSICDRGDVMPFAVLGDGFRTSYNVTMDVFLASAGDGAFIGGRTKGPVGSGTSMDGIFFAINETNWWMALSIGSLYNRNEDENSSKVIATGRMLENCLETWCTIFLTLSGIKASASINNITVASDLKIPAPYDHFTGKVAGDFINLGKGGYASFGSIGYSDGIEFDNLRIESSDGINTEKSLEDEKTSFNKFEVYPSANDNVPESWIQRSEQGNLLYATSNPRPGFFPPFGNGFISGDAGCSDGSEINGGGPRCQSDGTNGNPSGSCGILNIGGVFNVKDEIFHSKTIAVPHRAHLPNPFAVTVADASSFVLAVDLENGLYHNRSTIMCNGVKIEVELTTYAHRKYRSLLVLEIAVVSLGTQLPPTCIVRLGSSCGLSLAQASDFKVEVDNMTHAALLTVNRSEEPPSWVPSSSFPPVKPTSVGYAHDPLPTVINVSTDGKPMSFLATYRTSLEFSPDLEPTTLRETALKDLATYRSLANQNVLRSSHVKEWLALWTGGIEISGNSTIAKTINASLYYMLSSVREDWPYGMSPGGLSRDDYQGHSFWDCETWMLPNFVALYPRIAVYNLAQYRMNRLPAAVLRAKHIGLSGSAFPWESASLGFGVSLWKSADQNEIHITGDIAMAFRLVYRMTLNNTWLQKEAWPLIRGAANFFVSRVTKINSKNYTLLHVICPDEGAGIQNSSAYTNAVAAETMRFAASIAVMFMEDSVDNVHEFADLVSNWTMIADGMWLPASEIDDGQGEKIRVHPEYDGYTVKTRPYINQADVALMQYPLGLPMNLNVAINDLKFYQERSSGPSTAGFYTGDSAYSIAWLQLGNRTAADSQFDLAFQHMDINYFYVFMEKSFGNYGNLNFLTGSGGYIQNLIFGYAGIRYLDNGGLTFRPCVPPHGITSMTLRGLALSTLRFDIRFGKDGELRLKLLVSEEGDMCQIFKVDSVVKKTLSKVGDSAIFQWAEGEVWKVQFIQRL